MINNNQYLPGGYIDEKQDNGFFKKPYKNRWMGEKKKENYEKAGKNVIKKTGERSNCLSIQLKRSPALRRLTAYAVAGRHIIF
jgi:hypothetical protein